MPYKALIKDIKKYLKIFEYIQKVAQPDWLTGADTGAVRILSYFVKPYKALLGSVAVAVVAVPEVASCSQILPEAPRGSQRLPEVPRGSQR